MSKSPPIIEKPGRLQDLNSMLLSALCHLVALVALGLLTAASDTRWKGVKLLADAGESEATMFDDSLLADSIELEAAPEPAAAIGPVQLFDDIAVPTTDFAALDTLAENVATASGFEGLALGGRSEGDGAATVAATEFFGIGGYGQSFVYIVDCSDSMNERGKFDRARYELLNSIEQLGSDQRYFVIFFNDSAHPMEGGELVLATQEQVDRTARWVQRAEAHGGTNPLPALLHALLLRPDSIYFLSDGQFDSVAIRVLRQRNRTSRRLGWQQIPIHTIAFIDRSTEALMRTIARDSGGDYRFVK